jgi:hypothetical protein
MEDNYSAGQEITRFYEAHFSNCPNKIAIGPYSGPVKISIYREGFL